MAISDIKIPTPIGLIGPEFDLFRAGERRRMLRSIQNRLQMDVERCEFLARNTREKARDRYLLERDIVVGKIVCLDVLVTECRSFMDRLAEEVNRSTYRDSSFMRQVFGGFTVQDKLRLQRIDKTFR